jgi:uncharacterized membrane protein YkvA (DUF1232 family)
MQAGKILLVGVAILVVIYAVFVLTLYLLGRKQDARAWAGFIPDCVILFKRLLGDPDVPESSKLWLGGLILYLAMPIDLVPDFVPVAGQLDDAIIVALVLRHVLRRAGDVPIRQHWPGPQSSLETLMKFVKPSSGANVE